MLPPIVHRWQKAVILSAALCLMGAALFPQEARADTKKVTGWFTFDVNPPLNCPSTAILCATGTFNGGIQGSFENIIDYASPAPTPGVVYYSGKITIHTTTGDLSCDLDGAQNSLASTDGEFGEICVLTGGTGVFTQATGHLRLFGLSATQPPVLGEVGGGANVNGGDYRGKIVTP